MVRQAKAWTLSQEDAMRLPFLFAVVAMAISLGDTMAKPSSTGFKVGEPFPNLDAGSSNASMLSSG